MSSDSSNTILLLHPPSLDPTRFLSRLTERDLSLIDVGTDPVKWEIDNRYYTAQVEFRAFPVDKQLLGSFEEGGAGMKEWEDADVVVYIFDQVPESLPPQIVRLMASPRDIALAVCVLPDSPQAAVGQEGKPKDLNEGLGDDEAEETRPEDLFDELGMEFIDEVHPLTDEDDERPMPPLDIIRQTLHTHMWPGMTRKPLHASSQLPASPSSSVGSGQESLDHAAFDVTFDATTSPLPREGVQKDGTGEVGQNGETVFPDLAELRAQLASAEFESIDALDRYAHLFSSSDSDSGFPSTALTGLDGPYISLNDMDLFPDAGDGNQEYEKLADWLEKDDDAFEPSLLKDIIDKPQGEGEEKAKKDDWLEDDDRRFEPSLPKSSSEQKKPGEDWQDVEDEQYDPTKPSEDEGFEDDFDSFQSAQPRAETLALDPTPLLLHLQQVRSELSSLTNEDERRERAGEEVAAMLNMLGMGLDEGEQGLLDFDDFGQDDLADLGVEQR